MWTVLSAFAFGLLAGAIGMFFMVRNNPEWIDIEAMLKRMSKEKLEELKNKI